MQDQHVDGSTILNLFSTKYDGGLDWIDLAQVKNKWRFLVKAAGNLRFPQNAEKVLTN